MATKQSASMLAIHLQEDLQGRLGTAILVSGANRWLKDMAYMDTRFNSWNWLHPKITQALE
jgi:hypothetical protein